jgi:hypothetical protein
MRYQEANTSNAKSRSNTPTILAKVGPRRATCCCVGNEEAPYGGERGFSEVCMVTAAVGGTSRQPNRISWGHEPNKKPRRVDVNRGPRSFR